MSNLLVTMKMMIGMTEAVNSEREEEKVELVRLDNLRVEEIRAPRAEHERSRGNCGRRERSGKHIM